MFGYSSSNSSIASLYRWARSSLPHQSRRNVICSSGSTVSPLPGSPPALLPEQAVRASAAAPAAATKGRRPVVRLLEIGRASCRERVEIEGAGGGGRRKESEKRPGVIT